MASSSPAWVVDLATRPSRFFQSLVLLLHGLALLALLQAAGLPAPVRLLLAAVVAGMAAAQLRHERRQALRLREAGEEWWLERPGRRGMARLVRARTWRWLVVMELAGEWQGRRWREPIVVWADAVAPDDFRRLRVRLRCGAKPGAPAAAEPAGKSGAVAGPASSGRAGPVAATTRQARGGASKRTAAS